MSALHRDSMAQTNKNILGNIYDNGGNDGAPMSSGFDPFNNNAWVFYQVTTIEHVGVEVLENFSSGNPLNVRRNITNAEF